MRLNNILMNIVTIYEKLNRQDGNYITYVRHCPKVQIKNRCEILFCNGFMSDMTGKKTGFVRELGAQENFTVTTFDYFGHGLSSGEFSKGSISIWLEDTLAIIDEVSSGPLIVIGSSMGGWLMILAALQRPNRVKGLIGIAIAPDFTEEIIWKELISEDTRNKLMSDGIIHIPSEYNENGFIPITRDLIEDGRKHLLLKKPLLLDIPIHLLHGTEDRDIPWKLSYNFMENVENSPDFTLSLIKGGDHRLSSPNNLERLSKIIKEMQITLEE